MARNDINTGFKFRRNADIGTLDAETDDKYLFECFVDTGDLDVLTDTTNPKRIIVGRTGAGKTALIRMLKEREEHVIEIKPEDLSLNYIANSDILMFLNNHGLKLDQFFGLLWKHVFAVELLKRKYNLTTEEKTKHWLATFGGLFRKQDHNKEKALKYLQEWGNKFWNETEYRIKEFTTKLESDIRTAANIRTPISSLGVSGGIRMSEEEKQELFYKAQKVVNEIQLKELSDVIRFLSDDVFNDPQNKFFVVIDGLDENWVDDNLRYKLIRSLIETIRSFQKIPTVKIIIALRLDLLQTVFEATRDNGFQEEKYESLMLRLRWSRGQLEELIDKRVGRLIKEQYTSRIVSYKEIFPQQVGKVTFIDYLTQRTFLRPRDAILFINECLIRSENKDKIIFQSISEAEGIYSQKRLESLEYEWKNRFPEISIYVHILDRLPASFKLSTLQSDQTEAIILELIEKHAQSKDPVCVAAAHYFNSQLANINSFLIALIKALFTAGAIGIKIDGTSTAIWSQSDNQQPSDGQIKPSSSIYVHPIFWRVLGTKFDG